MQGSFSYSSHIRLYKRGKFWWPCHAQLSSSKRLYRYIHIYIYIYSSLSGSFFLMQTLYRMCARPVRLSFLTCQSSRQLVVSCRWVIPFTAPLQAKWWCLRIKQEIGGHDDGISSAESRLELSFNRENASAWAGLLSLSLPRNVCVGLEEKETKLPAAISFSLWERERKVP